MDNKTVQQILNLNRNFYESYADQFSKTRQSPWQGWVQIIPILKTFKRPSLLDVGCGNGRFYAFLQKEINSDIDYTGIDNSASLIKYAQNKYPNTKFELTNFLKMSDTVTNKYNAIVCFGIMHHIPSKELRKKFLEDIAKKLNDNAILVLTLWTEKPHESKTLVAQSLSMEKNDYVTIWDKDATKTRYVHIFDDQEIGEIKTSCQQLNLKLLKSYNADGPKRNSNLYLIYTNEK